MFYIEIIASLFTLTSIYLTTKDNILCWPTGIIGILFYAIIFYNLNLVADLGLQAVFLIQSTFAWLNWNKKDNLKITYSKDRTTLMGFTVLIYMIIFSITNNLNGNLPFLDSAVATFSIMGMFLLIFKKVESWIFWILSDIILASVFFLNELYISGLLYLVFLGLALSGLIKWIKYEKI